MADQLANITMYKTAFIQARASTEHRVVLEATKFPDNDSNRCLEESQDEKQELQGPSGKSEEPRYPASRISATGLGCPRTITT